MVAAMPKPARFLFEPTPHTEAADWLTNKPLVSRETFAGLLPELRARAFTVAGIESAAVQQRLRDTLADLPRGADWNVLKTQLIADLHPYLADPDDPENLNAARRRAELLLRTHGFQAYTVAQENALADQLDIFPFKQYLSMSDERVRPAHAALDGLVLPVNSPFWQLHTPPWDFGCRCRTAPLLEDEAAEIRQADATRPPEDRRTLEGPALAKLENEGRIHRTVRDETGKVIRDGAQGVDVRAPADKGDPATAYRFEPTTLRLTPDQLRARMDPAEWSTFEAWAKKQTLSKTDPTTVYDWLAGQPAPAVIPSAPATLIPKFTTRTEAEAWISTTLGIPAKLDGMDLDNAQTLAETLNDQVKTYGPAIQHAQFIGTSKAYAAAVRAKHLPDAIAQALKYGYAEGTASHKTFVRRYLNLRTTKSSKAIAFASSNLSGLRVPGVVINPIGYKSADLSAIARKSRLTNWTIAGDEPHGPGRATFIHELGHIIDYHLSARKDPKIAAIWKRLTGPEIVAGLSRYAATEPAELLAEAWAEYHTTASPRPIAVEIVTQLRALIKSSHPHLVLP